MYIRRGALICLVFLCLAGVQRAAAQAGGSISGTVKDVSGGVVPGVMATLTNAAIGTQTNAMTDAQGVYSFPNVPVGRYDLVLTLDGFKPVKRAAIAVDIDSRLQIDMTLEVGGQSEVVSVTADTVHVETNSTQIGQVVQAATMTTLSLNGRSFTDLLAIQPGVIPTTTLQPDSVIMAGVTGAVAPSGQLNPGNLSISGQRESANSFLVNGSDVQERMNGGTSIVPNLDSIDQFRVLTSNFDPQYGNYNGGIVSVITKSGSDAFHGSGFDFVRNTKLDARNYFSPERAEFKQQQPGGTLGGPIKKGKAFFFTDYQGTRTTQGIETGLIPVPSNADRNGQLADLADTLTGTVNGSYWASLLSQRLGYTVSPGEPYYVAGCTSAAQCVLPNATIPKSAWSAPAQHLLQYIPTPNTGPSAFSTGASAETVRDDKGSMRVDLNSRLGLLSAYYFIDDYRVDNPYPTQQGGASVPGFNALTLGRAQLFALSGNKVIGSETVNEFHFSYMRNANNIGVPQGGTGVTVASQGFVTGPGTSGIVVQAPQFEGVENVAFEKFVMGVTTTGVNQKNNTFHWTDNLSKVIGGHTLRAGGEFEYAQVDIDPNAQFNGTFSFSGSETGSDFADFLLGVPSAYIQAAGTPFFIRNKYGAAFAQDSWRMRSNVTLNYGVRWDLMEPWYDKYNQIQTFVAGQQSQVYPGAPENLVFPTDAGIPRTLSPARNKFSPRLGISVVPTFSRGILKTIFGSNNESSLRASYGRFYTAIPGLSAGIMYSIPPYGYNYISPAPPLFDQPFITAADGTNNGQPFPHTAAPLDASVNNPKTVDWSQLVPVNGDPYFFHDNDVPYTDSYMASIDRQLASRLLFTVSYVGNRGHNILVVQPTNPGDPSLCLSVSELSQVAPGSATCGPFTENGTFITAAGKEIDGTRPYAPDYGSITAQKTVGKSRYDALELNLHYTGSRGSFLAGYTLSKSMDTSSNLGEQINPFDANETWAPSSFDMRHDLVVSYNYELPIDSLFRHANAATKGWSVSGVTRFSSGFPVTLYNDTDTSLLGTFGNGVNNHLLDTPEYQAGCNLSVNHDPANGAAFNTSCFSLPQLGQLGNAPRRFFYGPGIENTDLSLLKDFAVGAGRSLQLRLEAFNVFNHPQFYGPGAVDGNVVSSSFGQVVQAAPPRLMQLAAKLTF
ncbi:MAG TPA: TonB-dependent receptor [Vicinamibacterales bacterium]|nr:TonB-dependent receptor [Vicinamibacterales bacterium]